jgi:hypothetical protein
MTYDGAAALESRTEPPQVPQTRHRGLSAGDIVSMPGQMIWECETLPRP